MNPFGYLTPRIFVGFTFVVGAVVLFLFELLGATSSSEMIASFAEMNGLGKFILIWGNVSALGLWGWMLTDYFRNPPSTYRVAWGWMLLFFNFIAAMCYFLSIYCPRIRKSAFIVEE